MTECEYRDSRTEYFKLWCHHWWRNSGGMQIELQRCDPLPWQQIPNSWHAQILGIYYYYLQTQRSRVQISLKLLDPSQNTQILSTRLPVRTLSCRSRVWGFLKFRPFFFPPTLLDVLCDPTWRHLEVRDPIWGNLNYIVHFHYNCILIKYLKI